MAGLVIREVPGLVITVSEIHTTGRDLDGTDPETETETGKLPGDPQNHWVQENHRWKGKEPPRASPSPSPSPGPGPSRNLVNVHTPPLPA